MRDQRDDTQCGAFRLSLCVRVYILYKSVTGVCAFAVGDRPFFDTLKIYSVEKKSKPPFFLPT